MLTFDYHLYPRSKLTEQDQPDIVPPYSLEQAIVVDAGDQEEGEGDDKEELEQLQTLARHHAEEAVLLVVLVDPREERIQIVDMVPSRCRRNRAFRGLQSFYREIVIIFRG